MTTNRRRLLIKILAIILSSLVGSNAQDDLAHLKGREWIAECYKRGFDLPACNTCQLLPAKHEAICVQCCQPYKDTQTLRKPYKSAIILLPKGKMEQEIENFINEDWNTLVESQGGKIKLQKLFLAEQRQESLWFLRTPAELLFLDETLSASKKISEKEARSKAKEAISLYGWKREDVKDMIETLLI